MINRYKSVKISQEHDDLFSYYECEDTEENYIHKKQLIHLENDKSVTIEDSIIDDDRERAGDLQESNSILNTSRTIKERIPNQSMQQVASRTKQQQNQELLKFISDASEYNYDNYIGLEHDQNIKNYNNGNKAVTQNNPENVNILTRKLNSYLKSQQLIPNKTQPHSHFQNNFKIENFALNLLTNSNSQNTVHITNKQAPKTKANVNNSNNSPHSNSNLNFQVTSRSIESNSKNSLMYSKDNCDILEHKYKELADDLESTQIEIKEWQLFYIKIFNILNLPIPLDEGYDSIFKESYKKKILDSIEDLTLSYEKFVELKKNYSEEKKKNEEMSKQKERIYQVAICSVEKFELLKDCRRPIIIIEEKRVDIFYPSCNEYFIAEKNKDILGKKKNYLVQFRTEDLFIPSISNRKISTEKLAANNMILTRSINKEEENFMAPRSTRNFASYSGALLASKNRKIFDDLKIENVDYTNLIDTILTSYKSNVVSYNKSSLLCSQNSHNFQINSNIVNFTPNNSSFSSGTHSNLKIYKEKQIVPLAEIRKNICIFTHLQSENFFFEIILSHSRSPLPEKLFKISQIQTDIKASDIERIEALNEEYSTQLIINKNEKEKLETYHKIISENLKDEIKGLNKKIIRQQESQAKYANNMNRGNTLEIESENNNQMHPEMIPPEQTFKIFLRI